MAASFTFSEMNRLRELYPTASWETLLATFPSRNCGNIRSKAMRMGIKRTGRIVFGEKGFLPLMRPEEFWVLGLLATDGCVYKNTISFTSADLELVNSVYEIIKLGTIRKSKGCWLVSGKSQVAVTRLADIGILPRKSLTISWKAIAKHIPDPMLHHFIRGLWDGDGCIGFNLVTSKRFSVLRTSFVSGSQNFIQCLRKVLLDITDSKATARKRKRTNCWQLEYTGKKAINLCRWMYTGSEGMRLERKYHICSRML